MKKLGTGSRIVIAIASLALVATYFFPVWFIHLIAPQYPEGLTMYIWLDRLSGQVEIINGLNHYIGMKHIEEHMFPEFYFLVYVVGSFIVLGLTVAATGSRKLLAGYLVITALGAGAALYDFYNWGYDYGHNLDPSAPIQVPGLNYQPPVVGHKKLLNFDAFSYPDTGGWIVIGVAIVFLAVLLFEWRKNRKPMPLPASKKARAVSTAALVSLLVAGCSAEPERIVYGRDACSECKMTIMDPKFGGEIVTKKGRVFKFDDAHCMAAFLERRGVELRDISQTLFVNYEGGDGFVNVNDAVFVLSSQLKSPMGSNAGAFASKEAAAKHAERVRGKVTDWPTIYNVIK